MLLAVRILSYGCTWEVWRAFKKLELLSAAPRATLTLLSRSPNWTSKVDPLHDQNSKFEALRHEAEGRMVY